MRLFPATARHRLVASCAAGVVALGTVSVPLAYASDHSKKHHLQQQQHHAQQQLHNAEADLDESSAQMRHAYTALTRSRTQLKAARSALATATAHVKVARTRYHRQQRALVKARGVLKQARSDLAFGKQAVVDQHAHLVNTVTSLYEQGDPRLVGFLSLMNSQSPADLTRRNEANNVVLDSQDQALDSLQAAEALLQTQEAQKQKAAAEVATRRERAHANLVLKQTYHRQAVDARAAVRRTVHERKHAWGLARKAKAHDQAKLAADRRKAHKIHEQLLAEIRREQLAAQRGHNTGYQGSTSGLLLPPFNGPITSPYGYRENPVMHYWGLHDGDDFGAACGTPIHAANDGTIMAEYYSDVWGNRLYINLGLVNGKNVTVIYNHLSAYRSTVGEHVARGQVVGLVGTTGWSTGCHTHFTVMVDGTAVDPTPWLS